MTFKDRYSQDPDAIRTREYYWSHEDYRQRQIDGSKKRYRAKKQHDCQQRHSMCRPNNHGIDTQVRFHLSRGRDAGDIAVRMNIPVSYVVTAMERIKVQHAEVSEHAKSSEARS